MKAIYFSALFSVSIFMSAQVLKSPPSGGNKKALVGEQIGITDVTVKYDRPGVKGREGKIYGTPVVHEGFQNLGFGTAKASPWRAGANENTIIEFSTNVKVEGKNLPAGKYGFFISYGPKESIAIFSKNTSSWGSYFYDEKEDALRIPIKPVPLDRPVEWLKYEFTDQGENSAVLALAWEKLMFPMKIEVDLVETRLANYREGLRGKEGFRWESFDEAASFCLEKNTSLSEGLDWAKNAVSFQANFTTLSTYASLLDKMGKKQSADSAMKLALEKGTMVELHQYGRKLVAEKKQKEALEVFTLNASKNPKQFTTYAGLARGYSANGDYKKALAQAKMALPLAPNEMNKASVQKMIEKLEKSTDIN
jgi:tetratricopeptide (TPR) repeat protein